MDDVYGTNSVGLEQRSACSDRTEEKMMLGGGVRVYVSGEEGVLVWILKMLDWVWDCK